MIAPLNPWIGPTLARAEKIYEDSDRKSRAAMLFHNSIRQVHRLATQSAIRCPTPKVERFQADEASPQLSLAWFDQASGWDLVFDVRRGFNVRPHLVVSITDDSDYRAVEKPTDQQITEFLYAYFEQWKRTP